MDFFRLTVSPTSYKDKRVNFFPLIYDLYLPGEADPSADPIGISKYPCRDDVTQGLQHVLQLLFIHRHWQVGDVQVCGVLLLLLPRQKGESGTQRREKT